jgi:hypothetical protein
VPLSLLGLPPAPPGGPARPPSALGPHRRSTKEGNSAGAGAIPSHIQAQLDTAKKLLTRMGSGLDKHSSLSAAEQQGDAALQLRRGRHTIGDVSSLKAGGSSSSAGEECGLAAAGPARSARPGELQAGAAAAAAGLQNRLGSGDFDRAKRHTVAVMPDLETVQEAGGSSGGASGRSSSDDGGIPRAEGVAEALI